MAKINPFQAIMGGFTPVSPNGGQNGQPMMGGPIGMLQACITQAQKIAGSFQNPQALVEHYFPNAPTEVRNDPDALANWMQQSGMVNPQVVQMARQLMGK